MIASLPLQNILFLDVETVPQQENFHSLSDEWKQLWETKAAFLLKKNEEETAESIYERAGIYAEFGKIICISCGIIQETEKNKTLTLKSFFGDDEKELLKEFSAMLLRWTNNSRYLCAHNGKEFDFPFLCRRFIINRLPLPYLLDIAGKKPWEVKHLDTMDLWKFGDYKSYTSLNLLAHTLHIPTSKDDIDGSMVSKVYYEEKNINRIVKYCQKDVLTLTQIFLRLCGKEIIEDSCIEIKKPE